MSNLAATPAAPFTAHPLRRRCIIITPITLCLSDLISYLANCLGPLCLLSTKRLYLTTKSTS
ncbi:hypothetical protein COCCADRAFT_10382 [Bipolaris zeicola 26-R-13]|uniref:Uncharacterized protein n=1 Tax=Cochliobolus carbonum (strain 26-R-13) TaxID=930089 RepID=W6XVP1_COCC2|nr:uncharacterized protein COCCADRAFT_10382 [Bipolaris zeicola 26-R-13]EUC26839.1 hypothetical protein COCCADRAFT_10382 [Bipolaris zeicola 26-R-13]